MKTSAFYSLLTLGIIVMLAIAWWGFHKHSKDVAGANATTTVQEASDTPSLSGLSIYTNGQYGFSMFYPAQAKTETVFDQQYFLPNTWRVDAFSDATGTPIIAIVGYETKSSTSYPRYFETEVRIGASTDPHEVAACNSPTGDETSLPDKVINGVRWKAFVLQNAGMMQYLKGISYRTIHDNTCFALEQVETGSSYRDTKASSSDIPDATLDQHYNDLSSIVESFSFARP
jgi:hypothetical protein